MLPDIIEHKRREVDERKELYSIKLLEKSLYFETPCVSLRSYLHRPDKVGIIAEIKRRSPSRGALNPYLDVERLSVGYMQAGASALSVLTDTHFFGGSNQDVITARTFNYCPILRKDFIIDEYQLIEAKSIGADAVLLIAAVLSPEEVRSLAIQAQRLGLESILEVHSAAELQTHLCQEVTILGVNNRDLTTFSVDPELSLRLAPLLPPGITAIAESGISESTTIRRLKEAGYRGFLIGEAFMRSTSPEAACRALVQSLRVVA